MDRRVKERLVGASILVVLIVLIVPELLSGPVPAPAASQQPLIAPEPVRNITVDLATSKAPAPDGASATDPATASSAAASSAAASSAAAANPAAPSAAGSMPTAPATTASHENAPAAAASGGASSAPPLEIARPSPTSQATSGKPATSGHWAVQLGSFASHENAEKLARQLKAQGFAVYVLPGGSGASLRYRVRVGPMADRGAATQTAAKLKSMGQSSSLVAPGA